MDTTQIIIAGISLLSGGGIFAAIAAIRKSKREDFSIYTEKIEKDNERLRLHNVDCTDKLHDERAINSKLMLISVAARKSPLPFYTRDSKGVFLYINEPFERAFGVLHDDCMGKDSIEIWGEERGKIHKDSNAVAMEKGVWMIEGPIEIPGFQYSDKWRIVEYRLDVNGVAVGTAGKVFPVMD